MQYGGDKWLDYKSRGGINRGVTIKYDEQKVVALDQWNIYCLDRHP